jgi:hypothetical protein
LTKIPALGEADSVLSAVRLGWGMAETRGRNRPDAPPGGSAVLPADNEHALPLRIERTSTELRIEAQALVAGLAKQLEVDTAADGTSFSAALDQKARLLYHMRAPKAASALADAAKLLGGPAANTADPAAPNADPAAPNADTPKADPAAPTADPAAARAAALTTLNGAKIVQEKVMKRQRQAVAAAKQALAAAKQRDAAAAGHPTNAATASGPVGAAAAALQLEQAASTAEARGLEALTRAADALEGADPESAVLSASSIIDQELKAIADSAVGPWTDLAELIWRFDAHIQDALAAASENQAIGYQFGRGLAETYWALDPCQPAGGATSWGFLLGTERCAELSRLAGRLGAYMNEFTAPAIAGSIDVWKAVAGDKTWRKGAANPALYNQIRRWYELVILGQDPTTLIQPRDLIRDYRVIGRTLKWFAPELAVLIIGVAALGALIVLLSTGGSAVVTTASGALAAVGLTAAGVVGKLKNSEQAMLTRLRQDAYTDLVAYAVQTAPAPADGKKLKTALAQRQLTPATPN